MKNIRLLLNLGFTIMFVTLLTVSCDKVDEPFTKKIQIDTSSNVHIKRVLLEDYTGHTCVNCPEAAVLAHNLKNNHGDKLVVLGIHAGTFAKPAAAGDFTANYTTAAGNEWDTYFGISNTGNPKGMVNRKGFSSLAHILSPSAWSNSISQALAEPLLVDLTLSNTYDSASRQLTAEVKIDFLQNINKNLFLVVLINESDIVSPQKNNNASIGATPIIHDYHHNHVLRCTVTSTWGTQIATEGVSHPASFKRNFNYTLDQAYKAANCSVIAFVYESPSKEILQVVEKKIIK